jgi:hypothetical protein
MDQERHMRMRDMTESIGIALNRAAPAGWTRVALTVLASVLAYDFAAEVRMADGRGGDIELPAEVKTGFQQLRELMYEPERGTWFSARLVLEAGGEPAVSFNFDEDPRWWPALHPTAFCRDLEVVPRSEEHIGPGLRELLAEGRELDRQRQKTQA